MPGEPKPLRGAGRAPKKVRRCILLPLVTDTLLVQAMALSRGKRNALIDAALMRYLPELLADLARTNEERLERKAAARTRSCPLCAGRGDGTCGACDGTGRVPSEMTVDEAFSKQTSP